MNFEDIRKKHGLGTKDKEDKETTNKSASNTTSKKLSYADIAKKHGISYDVDDKYLDSFISDANKFASADEATSYSTWTKLDLGSRASTIRGWLNHNKSSLDEESYKSFSETIDNFVRLNDHYSQFTTEDEYTNWYSTLKAEENYNANFENIDANKAAQGWQKYIADEEAAKNALKDDINNDGREAWWEKALGYLGGNGGGVVDTTLPNAGVTQTVNDLRADENYNRRPEKDWSEEQKNAFGQLYAVSPDLAEETNKRNAKKKEEEAIKEIQESATSGFGAGAGHTVGAIAASTFGLADYLRDLAMVSAGKDLGPDGTISPFEYSQAVTGGISEHLNTEFGTIDEDIPVFGGKGWGDVYNLGTESAKSMASAYALGPLGTLVSYFGQGAASATDDALARGASDEQALLYGTAVGMIEGVLESIGIEKLLSRGGSESVKGFIRNMLLQSGTEGLEEGFTSLFTNILDNAYMQDKSNFNLLVSQYMAQGMSKSEAEKKAWKTTLEGIAFDTIAGAASGGFSGGVQTGIQNVASNIQTKNIYGYDGGADLVYESLHIDPDNAFAQRMKHKLDNGKDISGHQMNRLLEANQNTLISQDKTKIKSAAETRLTELGETGDVGKIAEVITKQASGEELTRSEKNLINNSKYGQRVANELNPDNIKSGQYSSSWAEKIDTDKINYQEYSRALAEADATAEEKALVTENPTTKEVATEGKKSAPKMKATMTDGEGKTVEVKPQKLATTESGAVGIELENGDIVNFADVDLGDNGKGLVYQAAVDRVESGNFSIDAANVFVTGYDEASGQNVGEYINGWISSYNFGAMKNPPPLSVLAANPNTARLTEEQRETAYNFGKALGNEKVAKTQKKIDSTVSINAGKDSQKTTQKGKVIFDGERYGKTLNERQKASLKALGVLAEALNIDIRIFESPLVDGRRQGKNGSYNHATRTMEIDLFAGFNGEGTMLFTAAHELTHHIRATLPAKFNAFAEFLFKQYGEKGVSISELIENKIEHLKKNNRTEGMTEEEIYDLAYEEVVADACESFLADGEAVAKIAELKAKDKTLWETIKDFFTKLVARIKAAYEGLSPDSREGRLVAEMLDTVEQLKAMWTEMLVEASEVETTTELLGENGIMVDSKTDSATLYSVRDVLSDADRKKVSKALAERFDVTQSEAMEWLKAETSLASLILNPKYSQYLDYTADPNEEAIKSNSDYPQGTVDFSNICKKRRDFTEVMNRVLRNYPNHVFAATDLAKIRTIMEEEGMEVACAICYVEDRRQLDSVVAQNFIDSLALYREGSKTKPDGTPFNANQLKAFKLIEGDTYTPSIYELISLEGRNSLKAKNPAMEEAWVKFNNARGMQSVRLLLNDAEYKRQILKYSPSVVKRKNDLGGLRIYSFSDMEMFHLIDIIQVITDSATVGLSLQGYTKVNEYAKAVKDTGEKLNRSLIPKGDLGYHIEDGRVVLDFDTTEGIDINHPDFFDNIDNPNFGNIVIGINATQIKAAMTSKFIDQIIPFHTGQSNEVLGEKGIAAWDNYKDFQSERDVKTNKKSSHQINIYTEVINAAEAEGKPITNKVDFVNKFLEVCKENNLIPRFSEFLNVDENGNYVYTEGYHKFLVDFKTFDQNTGEYLPQMPVKPIFENEYITSLLTDYVKSQKAKDAEFTKAMPKVLDRITGEIVSPVDNVKYSDRDYSYESLISKPDMKMTAVDSNVQKNRADVVAQANKNASKVGKFNPKDGSVSVRVDDTGEEVVVSTGGLRHGLDRRFAVNAPVTVKAGEILQNSIRINEMTPDNDNAESSYALIGVAKNEKGELYIVRSVVNRFKSELVSMDTLYAINAKTEPNLGIKKGNQVGAYPQGSLSNDSFLTDSTISIAQLLEFVNMYFPDILPEPVLRHFGYDARPDGELGEKTLYSDRPTDSVSNRSLLAGALESVAQNDIERNKLKEYKGKIALIEAEQAKLSEIRAQIKELSFAKGPRDTEAIKKLQFEANQAANRINTYDRQLLNLEATAALKGVLQREKQMAYKKAEREGKEALAKYRERAAKTQQELLTRYQESRKKGIEGRRKTEMRHKIKDVVNELNQYLTKGTKEKHVPIELQKAVAEALDAVNMDTVGAEERIAKLQEELRTAKTLEDMQAITKKIERIQEMGGNLEAKLSRLKTAYDSIINSDDPLIANSHDDVISSSIDKVIEVVGDTPLRDMSLYQLEAVYDMYKMVLATIRNTNKAFKAAKGEEISTIANGVIAELMDKKRKIPYSSKGMQAMSEFDWNNLKPVYAFERIGSANFTKVFKAVRAGEDVWATDMSEAQAFRKEQFEKYKYDSWDFNKRYGFTSTSGIHFELSLDQILSLYAFSKRDQAGDHLKYGGFVFDGLTEVKAKNKVGITVTYQLKDATAYNLSEETLTEIIGKLTPEQRAFADAMQDYLSTVMGEKGNEVSLALYDIKLFKEKNYFPLRSAPQYLAKAKEQAQGEVKIKNSGFTKETTPKAKNPIVLSSFMDVWAGHVNEMSMYHAFTLPLEDFYRVYNYHTTADEKMEMVSVGASLENAHGQAAVKYIDQLLKDLNGGTRGDPREAWGKSWMSRFKKASVMASMSVVVQQPTAIVRAMALVDAKYFVGKRLEKGKHRELWEEVKKYAPVAIIKEMGGFDTGMGQSSVAWLKGEKTFMDKVDDATSKLPALADEVTWVAIWNAVKRETVHTHKNLRPGSEEFLKAVGERFTEVITKTQVYDSTLSRSANMRSKSGLMQMWTAFMAEPTTSINMLQDAFRKGNKKVIARTLGAVYGSVVLNSALVSLIYAMRDDDEDETFLEKYLSRFTTELIDGINPITYIPFFKDIWSLLQGFDVERADMSLINDLIDSLQQTVKVLNKDTSNMDEDELAEHKKAVTEAILGITDTLSSLVGVPVKNVRRDIKGIVNSIATIKKDVTERDTSAGSLGDNVLEGVKDSVPVWGWFPDDSKSDKLYDAIIKGDTAYIDRIKSGYKDDKAYGSAVRKALRENDPRIKEAAEARYSGDISKYMRLAKEIIAEGHFKQDDIVAAINSEINAMKKDEETTASSSNKATSIYKVDDYYAALVGRDRATASAVKEDLIKTEVANGKDRDEAEADFNSKFASHLRELYERGKISVNEAKNMLVNYGGKSEEDASSKVQYWDFKKRYPDYDLSEEAVNKYYAEVEPSGINIDTYYDYSKQRSKAKGTDANGDGKTDSGSVKKEVLYIIDSLPITYKQKDVLYYLNGWSASTIWEAPWH